MRYYLLLFAFSTILFSCANDLTSSEEIEYTYTGDITINGIVSHGNGDHISIAPGSTIRFAPGSLIQCSGDISIIGTKSEPITLISQDLVNDHLILRSWEGSETFDMMHTNVVNGLIVTHNTDCHFKDVIFSNTKDLEWNSAATRFWGGEILIEDCELDWNRKGEGFLVHTIHQPIVRNCTFKKVNDAVEYLDCTDGVIRGCTFLSNSDDAIDLNACDNIILSDNEFYGTQNRGIEVGDEGFGKSTNIKILNNLFVDCKVAVNVKENSDATIDNITVVRTETGLEIINEEDNGLSSYVRVKNSVFANTRWPSYSLNSTIDISDCMSNGDLHDGTNIIKSEVQFADTTNHDYRIVSTEFPVGLDGKTIGYQKK